jgi:hypothetical protein
MYETLAISCHQSRKSPPAVASAHRYGDRLRWQDGGVPQAELSISDKGHLADGNLCLYMSVRSIDR